jgi:hypothetical protein
VPLRVGTDADGAGRRNAFAMTFTLDPLALQAAMLLASLFMVLLGIGWKRLAWRTVECPVCHHPRRSCTCHWL